MKPLLTIVIPVYNRAKVVESTLDSIVAQSHRPLSVVLVDNNSSDNTFSVLNRWKEVNSAQDFMIDVVQEAKPGACAARNAGLGLVKTPWTMFFDSDDIMLPDHVAKVIEIIRAAPDVDVVGNKFTFIKQDRRTKCIRFINHDTVYNNISHSIFSTLLYCARTEIFKGAGGWDETLSMGDDVELGSRILALNPRIRVIKGAPTVIVKESGDSISNSSNRTFALVNALRKIQQRLPDKHKHWIDLQILIQLAAFNKGDASAAKLASDIISTTPARRRWLWKILYRHTLAGHRGAARIYNILRRVGL